jgi:hypothetical protein
MEEKHNKMSKLFIGLSMDHLDAVSKSLGIKVRSTELGDITVCCNNEIHRDKV